MAVILSDVIPGSVGTVVSDDFDSYANNAVLGSQAGWRTVTGWSANMLISKVGALGEAYASDASGPLLCTTAVYTENQFSELTFGTVTNGLSMSLAVAVAVVDGTDLMSVKMYYINYTPQGAGSQSLQLYAFNAGSSVVVAQTTAGATTFVAGDTLRLERIGSGSATRLTVKKNGLPLSVFINKDPGAGYYLSGGAPGIMAQGNPSTVRAASWRGGNLGASPPSGLVVTAPPATGSAGPVTIASDDFDSYANNAVLGSQTGWVASVCGNHGTMGVKKTGALGDVASTNSNSACCYTTATCTENQFSEAVFGGALTDSSSYFGVAVSAISNTYYRAQYQAAAAASEFFSLYQVGTTGGLTGGGNTSPGAVKLAVGDVLRLERVGTGPATRLTVKKNGVPIPPLIDVNPGAFSNLSNLAGAPSYISGGAPGVYSYSSAPLFRIMSWTGGNLPAGNLIASDLFDSYTNGANLDAQPGWQTLPGFTTFTVVNPGATGEVGKNATGTDSCNYSTAVYGDAQYSEMTIGTATGTSSLSVGVIVSAIPGTTIASDSLYYAQYIIVTGSISALYLIKQVGGVAGFTLAQASNPFFAAAGDKLRLTKTGTGTAQRLTVSRNGINLTGFINIDPGAANGGYITGGAPGIYGSGFGALRIASWIGGNS
jgi:hypothetical protein